MKKFLIIRFSSIGDIVLTTPVIRCLKEQTGATVHYLTKSAYAPLLEANPYLARLFTIEKNVNEVIPDLQKEGYDHIIDLHKNLRSLQVRKALSAGTFTFPKVNFEKWLLVNFKVNLLPKLHIVDRYMQAVASLGVKNDGQGLDYFLPEGFEVPLLQDIHEPYIAFAIGAAHPTKCIPEAKAIEICSRIQQSVVLLGGENEVQAGETIARKSGTHVTNLCGTLSLHGSAVVLKNADRVITPDTGMMHIAAAFQKEILSVWGNTVPEFGMSPYYGSKKNKNIAFEVKALSCRPCSKIGFEKCPKGHFRCMNDQDVEKIASVLRIV